MCALEKGIYLHWREFLIVTVPKKWEADVHEKPFLDNKFFFVSTVCAIQFLYGESFQVEKRSNEEKTLCKRIVKLRQIMREYKNRIQINVTAH